MPTLNLQVSASNRDGFQPGSGLPNITEDYFAIGNYTGYSVISAVSFIVPDVPSEATIISATLTIVGFEDWTAGVVEAVIYGEAADNSAVLAATTDNIRGRTKTTASVSTGDLSVNVLDQDFPFDVTSLVQEIVDRPGWSAGNALTFLIDDEGLSDSEEWNGFWQVDGSSSGAARLDLEYSVTGGVLVTPAAAVVVAGTLDPLVGLGSLAIGPGLAVVIAAAVNPGLVLGSVAVVGAVAGSSVSGSGPMVVLGNLVLTPGAAAVGVSGEGPTVVLGSLVVGSGAAAVVVTSVDPDLVLGSVVVMPGGAGAVAASINPIVFIDSDGLIVYQLVDARLTTVAQSDSRLAAILPSRLFAYTLQEWA